MRSILEFGTPIWHSSISEHDADRIEQVQKKVFRLVLQKQYKSYEEACLTFKTQSLKNRREQLCLKFARKEVKREDSIFTKYKPTIKNRHTHKKLVQEFYCRTDRFYKSAIPYLARMINEDHANKSKEN